jgi:transcriptional regulator with XRE-family HTH domain
MAGKLRVTPSYLSAIETGKRNIPDSWPERIAVLYGLGPEESGRLREAARQSAKIIVLPVAEADPLKKEAAILFAREFAEIDTGRLVQIRNLLKEKDRESDTE